mmetsp:Transcript_16497/g.36024  ORF Transcript_16497/g.36024 Transcript_16497/m.36024 type:complete len:205 (-) Transcript_16497:105-719(-)
MLYSACSQGLKSFLGAIVCIFSTNKSSLLAGNIAQENTGVATGVECTLFACQRYRLRLPSFVARRIPERAVAVTSRNQSHSDLVRYANAPAPRRTSSMALGCSSLEGLLDSQIFPLAVAVRSSAVAAFSEQDENHEGRQDLRSQLVSHWLVVLPISTATSPSVPPVLLPVQTKKHEKPDLRPWFVSSNQGLQSKARKGKAVHTK